MNDVTHQKVTDGRNWLLYCGTSSCQWIWVYFYKLASYLRENFLESVNVKRNMNFYHIEAHVEEIQSTCLCGLSTGEGFSLSIFSVYFFTLTSLHFLVIWDSTCSSTQTCLSIEKTFSLLPTVVLKCFMHLLFIFPKLCDQFKWAIASF